MTATLLRCTAHVIRLAALAGVAVCTTACASTGAVPKPFPMPATTASARPPEPPVPPALPGSPHTPAPASRTFFDAYALAGTALSLRGAPYRDGGTDPNGFDCSGFTQYVFAQYGVPLPRGVRDQFRWGKAVKPEELAAGDLIFFATTEPGASHVAIAVGGDEFVHAPSTKGVVRVERLNSNYWGPRYLGARRGN